MRDKQPHLKELDLAEAAVRRWVRQAEIDAGPPGHDRADAEEVVRLRKQLREGIEEPEILKRAVLDRG